VITGVVVRFLSRQQRPDKALRIAGVMAFAAAAVCGVLTVTGLLPGVSAAAVGAVLAGTVWLLAIGVRGAGLPGPRRARVARTARLIAVTALCSGVVALTGFAIGAAVVWAALIAGCLAWLSIPSGSWPWAGPWRYRGASCRSQQPPPRHFERTHDHENRIPGARLSAGLARRCTGIADRVRR
jgi:hypothetical protein